MPDGSQTAWRYIYNLKSKEFPLHMAERSLVDKLGLSADW